MKDRIKKIRESIPEHGKTQETFANFLGISKANLSSYESGRRNPSDGVVKLICEKCNVNFDWIAYGKEPMFKEISNKLSFYLGQIKGGDYDFIKDLIEVYMELDVDSKQALRTISERMAEKRKNREQN